MSIMCCNSVVEHRYCPICGKDNTMVKDVAYQLLGHCRLMAKTMETRVQSMKAKMERYKNAGETKDGMAYYRGRLDGFEGTARKWQDWADRLEQLMEREGVDL